VDVLDVAECNDRIEKRPRQQQPAESQPRREGLADGAAVGDVVRVERLQRADRLAVVP
jgi:hypothetical protein